MKMGYKNFEGIDLAVDNIELVNKIIPGKAYLEDAFNFLPQRKNLYDLIHSRDVIEHIPKNVILAEMVDKIPILQSNTYFYDILGYELF